MDPPNTNPGALLSPVFGEPGSLVFLVESVIAGVGPFGSVGAGVGPVGVTGVGPLGVVLILAFLNFTVVFSSAKVTLPLPEVTVTLPSIPIVNLTSVVSLL